MGAGDPRAQSFIHLMQNVLPNLVASGSHPKYLLVENVAGFEVRGILYSGLNSPSMV